MSTKVVQELLKHLVNDSHCSIPQIRGHIKGKTLLPFPQQGAKRIEEEEKRARESSGEDCDMLLKNNIEGIIIKWAHQSDEVSKYPGVPKVWCWKRF